MTLWYAHKSIYPGCRSKPSNPMHLSLETGKTNSFARWSVYYCQKERYTLRMKVSLTRYEEHIVGWRNAELRMKAIYEGFTFSACLDAMFFHESPNLLFPNSQVISPKFSPDSLTNHRVHALLCCEPAARHHWDDAALSGQSVIFVVNVQSNSWRWQYD